MSTKKKAPAKAKKAVAKKPAAKKAKVVVKPEPFEPAPVAEPEVVEVIVVKAPFVPTEWRKRQGNDTWHFVPSCRNWPTENFRARTEAPTTGERCDECLAKAKGGI